MPLARLPKVWRESKNPNLPELRPARKDLPPTTPEVDKYAPQGLSQSREEEYIRPYLEKRPGRWYQQKGFQATRTSADFTSDFYRAVIQADGAYFHDPKAAKDAIFTSIIKQRGYRVERFRYASFDECVKNFGRWYNERWGA
jgi:hypothetical protein